MGETSPSVHDHAICRCSDAGIRRRDVLRLTGVALCASLAGIGWQRPARAGHADALLLCCMDYRLVDDVTRYMEGREMKNDYDQVILAGASLGALNERFTDWGKTFREHVAIAKDLHHINKVIVMDHRDCGAYKVLLGEDLAGDPARERDVHARYQRALAGVITAAHPDLQVELLLMALDGSVEPISAS